jgi:hypothetical protein
VKTSASYTAAPARQPSPEALAAFVPWSFPDGRRVSTRGANRSTAIVLRHLVQLWRVPLTYRQAAAALAKRLEHAGEHALAAEWRGAKEPRGKLRGFVRRQYDAGRIDKQLVSTGVQKGGRDVVLNKITRVKQPAPSTKKASASWRIVDRSAPWMKVPRRARPLTDEQRAALDVIISAGLANEDGIYPAVLLDGRDHYGARLLERAVSLGLVASKPVEVRRVRDEIPGRRSYTAFVVVELDEEGRPPRRLAAVRIGGVVESCRDSAHPGAVSGRSRGNSPAEVAATSGEPEQAANTPCGAVGGTFGFGADGTNRTPQGTDLTAAAPRPAPPAGEAELVHSGHAPRGGATSSTTTPAPHEGTNNIDANARDRLIASAMRDTGCAAHDLPVIAAALDAHAARPSGPAATADAEDDLAERAAMREVVKALDSVSIGDVAGLTVATMTDDEFAELRGRIEDAMWSGSVDVATGEGAVEILSTYRSARAGRLG